MPVQVRWHLEDSVLLVNSMGVMTLDEVEYANERITKALDSALGSDAIHIIHDSTSLRQLPMNIEAVGTVLNVLAHPRLGCVVAFGIHDVLTETISTLLTRRLKVQYAVVETEAEAYAFVANLGRPGA